MEHTRQGQRRTRTGTRLAILDAARRLIEADGAENVRLEDVAHAAGCSRRAIYLHFPSRTALLLALPGHIDELEGQHRSAVRIWDAPDAYAALDAFTRHVAEYHPRIAATVRAVDGARRTDPDAAALWSDRMDAWHGMCRRLAEWLHRDGVLAERYSVEEAADVLWASMSVRLWEDLVETRGWDAARFRQVLHDLLARALTTERADPASPSACGSDDIPS